MSAHTVIVAGRWAPRFDRVVSAFRRNFSRYPESGAACAVYVGAELVVDIWGGEARPGVPWSEDTLAIVWSTTKGISAACVALLADRGLIDVTRRVCEYWPEFGKAGKEGITVAHVLTHMAGLPYWDGYQDLVTIDDTSGWGRTEQITSALADAKALWPPGHQMAYHAITFGWLVGEIVRRITGESIGSYFKRELAEPLGLDTWIGLPAAEHHRMADLLAWPQPQDQRTIDIGAQSFSSQSLAGRTMLVSLQGGIDLAYRTANSARFREVEAPAVNAATTAASLARLYAMLAQGGELDGNRLIRDETVHAHSALWAEAEDLFAMSYRRRALGFARPSSTEVYGPNDEAFGHAGMGGSLGFADPIAGIGFGYVMNQTLSSDRLDPRAQALIYAVYDSLWSSAD